MNDPRGGQLENCGLQTPPKEKLAPEALSEGPNRKMVADDQGRNEVWNKGVLMKLLAQHHFAVDASQPRPLTLGSMLIPWLWGSVCEEERITQMDDWRWGGMACRLRACFECHSFERTACGGALSFDTRGRTHRLRQ
jgi:hypothetical protein